MSAITAGERQATSGAGHRGSRARTRKVVGRVVLYLAIIVGAIFVSIPWTWTVLSSLKGNIEVHNFPPTILPRVWRFDNYITAISGAYMVKPEGWTNPWPRLLGNTLFIALCVEIGTLLSNSFVAFGFSRLRWRLRNPLFFAMLATMFLPSQVTMIPTYFVFVKYFHWTNTWYPQILPAFFASAGTVFLLRQFMMTIPVEMDEAARLDGCSDLGLFFRIIMPMSKPALGAIAILTFQYVWNDFFTPLLYIRDPKMMNMAWGIASARMITEGLSGGAAKLMTRDELSMAFAVMGSLPIVILFFIFQRYYIQGIVITGVKG